jgi:hypothetical protein
MSYEEILRRQAWEIHLLVEQVNDYMEEWNRQHEQMRRQLRR